MRNHKSTDQQSAIFAGARLVLALFVLAFAGAAAPAQDRSSNPVQGSELGRENLSRVAASTADVKAVLLKDTGLLRKTRPVTGRSSATAI